ncbi:allantoicase [Streptomyces sp. WMMB 322]|uniref:allantoicase n=1 Tax=Streptomyces sp. WMMB 322 TaxID=1286821 RepID=UPI000823903A|nr:allantoicase [Streptomyces sp. WMMB 322]SCK42404.1 allantoicase [Streptomyces sp. WMMB 322]
MTDTRHPGPATASGRPPASAPAPATGAAPATGPDARPGEGLPRFTGDANPYRGGDPYADYRTAEFPFAHLPDLADRRLGAGVTAANDEFFAERENLLKPDRAEFDPERFGHKGKIMDGWETRRRRGAGAAAPHPAADDHDWALVRLGAPGIVHGIVVDTAHFRGNYPRAVSVEGACVPGAPSPEELLDEATDWTVLVPETVIGGHAANGFTVDDDRRFTHLRVNQHPDGGIARLRVYGEVAPDPAWLAALGTFDLVALENGGHVQDASDRFYSPPGNTILPGRPRQMDDGWETRRRRDSGNDWIRYALTAQATVRAVEIDTGCLKGNAAGWAALWGRDGEQGDWCEMLPRTRLQPDTVHRFLLDGTPPVTHVRLDIHPDGGIARLRLHGSLTGQGVRDLEERHRRTTGDG